MQVDYNQTKGVYYKPVPDRIGCGICVFAEINQNLNHMEDKHKEADCNYQHDNRYMPASI